MEYAHFLSRLSRVSLDQVELSLSLYRDPGLTQQLLREVAPDNVKRVAVSLADPVKGPFLVLSRKGHFVTCLGEGMVPNGLRVVTRAKLDSVFARVTDLRSRFDAIHAQTRREGTVREVFLRLLRSGSRFSREDYQTLSVWSPLLATQLCRMWRERYQFMIDSREVLCSSLRRGRPVNDKLLRYFWSSCYSLGHITTLLGDDGLRPLLEKNSVELGCLFGELPFYANISSVAARGVWFFNRLGRRLVSPLKRILLDNNRGFIKTQSAFMGLAALGFGHQRLHAEISKLFQRLGKESGDPKDWDVFGEESKFHEEQLHRGRVHLFRTGKLLPKESPYHFKSEEEVPDGLARTCAANLSEAVTLPGDYELGPSCVLSLVPWLARAKGEDLYLPREVVRHSIAPYTPQAAIQLLQRWTNLYIVNPTEPVRVEAKPGRNEPCECGSGQKFKRCHGQ